MRRALTALSVLGLALALAVPATAATPSPARLAAQIRTLQKQVKTLQKTVKTLRSELNLTENISLIAIAYGACNTAITADALQGSRPDQFGTAPVTDYSPLTNNGTACGDLSRGTGKTVVRQPNAPNVNGFQALLNIFK
jgi:acid phosphatase class B